MSDITKLSKNELITSIEVYYLKKGINCENLTKFSRNKLMNLMILNMSIKKLLKMKYCLLKLIII